MDKPVTPGSAAQTATAIRQLADALDEAVRVLLADKFAAGRVAAAEARLTALGGEIKAAEARLAAVAAEVDAERLTRMDALAAELATERRRIARAIESERLAVTRLEEQHRALALSVQQKREGLVQARAVIASELDHARQEADAVTHGIAQDVTAARAHLGELAERVEAKRKEYQALLEQVKAVLRA